jgi:phospholipase C
MVEAGDRRIAPLQKATQERSIPVKPRAATLWGCAAVVFSLAACSGGATPNSIPASSIASGPHRSHSVATHDSGSFTPIQHIVVIVQENRTMNNLFATFPGVTGTTIGKRLVNVNGKETVKNIKLKETTLFVKSNPNHNYSGFITGWDNGKMDNFNNIKRTSGAHLEGAEPYQYVNPSAIVPYWDLAREWGLANAMFTTQGSASFTAHQAMIRGGTMIDANDSLIDNLRYSSGAWGCDSPGASRTSLITTQLVLEKAQGPFPCTSDFPGSGSNYATLRDLMDNAGVSWKYYAPQVGTAGGIWSAFDVISPVRFGPEWGTNVSWPETNILNDIGNGQLPAMSWVIPNSQNSDHPQEGSDTGPSWVASVVNAVGESQYWSSTAIIITWDDWGGFYDPVPPPPRDNQGGPGFRVPLILVSPYARETSSSQPGYISQTTYEFGSIVQFVEDTFNLGRLGTTDGTTNSIDDMFDFYQYPRQFQSVGSKYSRTYFMHQKPSRVPVDDI